MSSSKFWSLRSIKRVGSTLSCLTVGDDGYYTALADCEGLYHKELPRSAKIYVENLRCSLLKAYEIATRNRHYNVNISKIYYDRNIKPAQYQVGDLVLTDHVKIKVGLKHGLAHKYHGPFKILAKHPNNVDYLIRKADSPKARKILIHHNRLKKYFGQVDETPGLDISMRQLNCSVSMNNEKRAYNVFIQT